VIPVITCNLAALTIAAIYYAWRDGYVARLRKQRILRERVAYMLWCAANRAA
jgi:hypothetical protein